MPQNSPDEHNITIALLKQNTQAQDKRLMKLEDKFDKMSDTLSERFDKFEEANERRYAEAKRFQEQVLEDLKHHSNDITGLNYTQKSHENEIKLLKTDVTHVSNFVTKAAAIISIITTLAVIFGKDIFKIFFQ